jgi:hypothetical protein
LPNVKPSSRNWPRDLDDLRAEPSRLVTLGDLCRLGIIRSYHGSKKLPKPLTLPAVPQTWEARTILAAIGASLEAAPTP